MKFAVYASGHGYGHLTRILEVVREIIRLHPSSAIHVRAPFTRERVQDFLGFPPTSHESVRMDVGLVQYDSLRHDHEASLQRLRFFFGKDGNLLIKREAEWLHANGINAALIDIPPHAFAAAHQAGIPSFGIGNFSWDSVWRDLAGEHPEYNRFADAASAFQSHAEVIFSGGMELGLESFRNVERVPLIARRSSLSKAEAKGQLGFSIDRPVVLIAFGGEGLKGLVPPSDALMRSYQFVATPPLDNVHPDVRYLTERELTLLSFRYSDLVRAADVTILKPGYSTVAECAANDTAVVIVPRITFPEADIIQRYVEENLPSVTLPTEDFLAGRWDEAVNTLFAKRPFDFVNLQTNGAAIVAQRILERLRN
ncbi:MAG: hypothetical protein V2A56_13200 [bacterium]